MYTGVDLPASRQFNLHATGNGVIEKVTYEKADKGYHLVINHGYGYKTLYAHLEIYKFHKN